MDNNQQSNLGNLVTGIKDHFQAHLFSQLEVQWVINQV